jgi:hypothetical protein
MSSLPSSSSPSPSQAKANHHNNHNRHAASDDEQDDLQELLETMGERKPTKHLFLDSIALHCTALSFTYVYRLFFFFLLW